MWNIRDRIPLPEVIEVNKVASNGGGHADRPRSAAHSVITLTDQRSDRHDQARVEVGRM